MAVGLAAAPAQAGNTTGNTTGNGDPVSPRPGPPILYARPPRAPQLENAPGSGWHATPILISGTSAYRQGEFLYQDYLFDDRGAGETYTYPTDPRYAGDAADLVEFRLRPQGSGLTFRLTYSASGVAESPRAIVDATNDGSIMALYVSRKVRPDPCGLSRNSTRSAASPA